MSDNIRIDKLLSNMGYGSRKDIKRVIRSGLVKVDDKAINKSSIHVNPYESIVEFNGERIEYREYIYIMMNKPQGVISATYDNYHETVLDLLEEKYLVFEPFPMGRLDIDTEGLLILTNDGKLSHKVLSPNNHIPKAYLAHIDSPVNDEDKISFKEGIVLDDGYECKSAELIIKESGDISKVELTIYEGKFHQVKRMFKALGKEVVYLKRIAMGNLKLDMNLELGEYRELTEEEIALLSND